MRTEGLKYYHFVSVNGSDRYFKVDWVNQKCTQIVLSAGDKKKGRPHCLGISQLALSSFRGSYYWYFGRRYDGSKTKLLLTTENQFKTALIKVIQQL